MNLTEAIKAVAPHSSKDKTLPVLTGVMIRGGRVLATDRYTLAIVTMLELDPAITVWLSPADVKAGVQSVAADLITFTSGAAKAPTEAPMAFPAIERLVDDFKPNSSEQITDIGFDVAHLSKFAARFLPKAYHAPVTPRFAFGLTNTSAARVTFAAFPEYVALIVPTEQTEHRP